MSLALTYLGLGLFAILPPLVLYGRFRLGQSLPWWLVVVLIAVAGWFFVNLGNYFYGQYACEAVVGVSNPHPDAIARCTNDGARDVFTLLFGWLYALLYSVPFFLVFALATWLRRRFNPGAHAI